MNNRFARSTLAAAVAVATLALASTASAQNWMIGVRALSVNPDASSSLSGLDVKDAWWAELDITYFFTKNIAAEVIAGTNKHEVTLGGASLGKVGVLPPTVTVQYHFTDLGAFKPYVGAGINYTYFYDNDGLAGGTLKTDNDSFGGALQAGLDYEIQKNLYFNLDAKYVWMNTDVIVKSTGAVVTKLDINPWIIGVGVRYRF